VGGYETKNVYAMIDLGGIFSAPNYYSEDWMNPNLWSAKGFHNNPE
jgi:hypothetical protein